MGTGPGNGRKNGKNHLLTVLGREKNMKTNKKRLRVFFLFTAVFMMLMSLTVMAKTVDLKFDKYYNEYIGRCKATEDGNLFFKLKVSKYGLLDVSGQCQYANGQLGGINVTLVNSKGKVLDFKSSSPVSSGAGTYVRYAVAPGTYYFKVPAKKGTDYAVQSVYALTGGHSGGATKSKAVKLKRNKTKTGVISASSFKAQKKWFKFYVPEQSRAVNLKLMLNGGQGRTVFYISGPNIKGTKSVKISPDRKYQKYTIMKLYQRVTKYGISYTTGPKAGWYYVRVCKPTSGKYKRSSGQFALQWTY